MNKVLLANNFQVEGSLEINLYSKTVANTVGRTKAA